MSIYTDIVIGSWVVFILYWGVSAIGVKRDINRSLWWRFAWLRFAVIAVILSVLWKNPKFEAVIQRFWILPATSPYVPLAVVGAVLGVLGTAYAIWARVHLGRNWSPIPNVKEEHELVTSGPYRLVRHPIYTGMIVAALGTAFVIPVWFAIFAAITAMFIWRVRVEEDLMTKQFPNHYPEYKKHTWALIPYVW